MPPHPVLPSSSLQVVQVAGTKGKGSTSMMLSNILRASGYNVGTYTRFSPDAHQICCVFVVASDPTPPPSFDPLSCTPFLLFVLMSSALPQPPRCP